MQRKFPTQDFKVKKEGHEFSSICAISRRAQACNGRSSGKRIYLCDQKVLSSDHHKPCICPWGTGILLNNHNLYL